MQPAKRYPSDVDTTPISGTYEDYLSLEARSELKHEFFDGHIYAMSGGTFEHARLAGTLSREIGNALRGRPCNVYSSDLRIRVKATGLATYPDLSVVCGKPQSDETDPHTLVNPILLVEILSPSTQSYDRIIKLPHYKRIPSLVEYLMVSQTERAIDVVRRIGPRRWEMLEVRDDEPPQLASIDATLDLSSIYTDPAT